MRQKNTLIILLLVCFSVIGACARSAAPPMELYLVAHPESGGKLLLAWESEDQIAVVPEALATAEDIAALQLDTSGSTRISVQLKSDASQRVKEVTAEHLNEQLAIVIEGRVLMTPTIKAPIEGGRLSLSASSDEETRQIYKLLESVSPDHKPPLQEERR